MDPKTTDWRAGPNVCRCCLAEGCYKDISTEYFWMGKREVYAEMLSETLNLSIAYSNSGGPNSNSRLICELCISRLRDASDFKRQVQECERTFLRHLDPGSSSMVGEVEVTVEPTEIDPDVKLEHVKQEKAVSDDDDDFDERCGFDEDDDDDLDDQPLTRLASRIPKKESVDLLDLLDNTKATEKRKSSSKTKTVPAKKAKTIKKDVKATSSKAPVKTEKKKKELNPMYVARQNAKMMIEYTTAYPFKLPESSMVCVYCCDSFQDPAKFRDHMTIEHQDFNVRMAFAHIAEGSVKVDCTDLKCRICLETFPNLELAADHLMNVHNKNVNPKHDLGLHPFNIFYGKYACAICSEKFSTLALLSKHTHTHFVQYTCDACGKSYASLTSLQCHLRYNCGSGSAKNRCRKCRKMFTSVSERTKHLEKSIRCRQHVCNICGDRFLTWNMKQTHLKESHNVPEKSYNCPECHIVFTKRDKLRLHFKTMHTNDYVECSYCEKKFDNDRNLKKHIVVHTGERNFICPVCSKAFPRKSTLGQHMWIHSAVKKHECKMCDKTFNQRVSWRTHMKSRHPELCVF
ncbi:zinc finger protein 729-like isoform X14 [Spodoptera litura]|uniref:Zinc finger protein 729-like isoform X14 n=1 Tax=Spodoptera litura TaxID=69820 RepID=A0A9J7IM24_SPOLT|nr:zinc finger protein 729-like isoform X14 [Spodoptera litura]